MSKNYTDITADTMHTEDSCPKCGNDDCDTLRWQAIIDGTFKADNLDDAVNLVSNDHEPIHCMKCGTIYEVGTKKILRIN